MESLVKAMSDFLAAVLGRVGFVGRPRRRAAIHDDLQLLDQLRDSSDFGPESPAHHFLRNHIGSEETTTDGDDETDLPDDEAGYEQTENGEGSVVHA